MGTILSWFALNEWGMYTACSALAELHSIELKNQLKGFVSEESPMLQATSILIQTSYVFATNFCKFFPFCEIMLAL